MSEPDGVDAPLLEALGRRPLVLVRTPDDRSVVVEHDGRRVVVCCTDRALLSAWWQEHADADAPAPTVRELSLREVLGLWAAPDVDLLLDPGPGGGVVVPVGPARRHLGLGPVVPEGDGSEPLPFAGFTGTRRTQQVPLLLLVIALVLLAVGALRLQVWFVLAGVLGLVAAYALGRRGFVELTAARRATRRLAQARRGQPPARP